MIRRDDRREDGRPHVCRLPPSPKPPKPHYWPITASAPTPMPTSSAPGEEHDHDHDNRRARSAGTLLESSSNWCRSSAWASTSARPARRSFSPRLDDAQGTGRNRWPCAAMPRAAKRSACSPIAMTPFIDTNTFDAARQRAHAIDRAYADAASPPMIRNRRHHSDQARRRSATMPRLFCKH